MQLIRMVGSGYGKRAEYLFFAEEEHEDDLLLALQRGSKSAVIVEVTLEGERHQALKLTARHVPQTVRSYVVALTFHGPQKIGVIKLIREVTTPTLGLKEAKDLAEAGGEIVRRKTEEEAEAVAQWFRELGATVVVLAEDSDESDRETRR